MRPIYRPFLKWAGGKSRLLHQLRELYPENFDYYYEPFLGGGAVLFDLLNDYGLDGYFASDINKSLITVYQIVKFDAHKLLDICKEYQKLITSDLHIASQNYYEVRKSFNSDKKIIDQLPLYNEKGIRNQIESDFFIQFAAKFLYLNKTCYNGLYRENAKGEFNVPFNKNPRVKICDPKILKQLSDTIFKVNFSVIDAATLLTSFKVFDGVFNNVFVYLDPPYIPISKTENFTQYQAGGFNSTSQELVVKLFHFFDGCGFKVMLSNSSALDLEGFKDFDIHTVSVTRAIRPTNAYKVSEFVITNYTPKLSQSFLKGFHYDS